MFDLFAEIAGNLEPDGFERVVAGDSVYVRSGDCKVHARLEGRRMVSLLFQHHFSGTDGNEFLQPFELLPQPSAEAGVGSEAPNSELNFHNARCCELRFTIGESSYAPSR